MEGEFSGKDCGKDWFYDDCTGCGNDLKLIFQFHRQPQADPNHPCGNVDLADDVILNKQVALKVVTLHKIKDPYVSKNLKRESAIMEKLNHPIIVARGRLCRRLLLPGPRLLPLMEATRLGARGELRAA